MTGHKRVYRNIARGFGGCGKHGAPKVTKRKLPVPQINTRDTVLAQLQARSLKYLPRGYYGGS